MKADGGAIVTKANALIEASYNLTLNEQRLILACAAKLDGRKPMPRDAVFVLAADEFVDLFDIDPRYAYAEMEEAATRLYERDIRRIEGSSRKRLRWVYMAEYKKGEGKVRLGFSPEIAPYLTMLHKRFIRAAGPIFEAPSPSPLSRQNLLGRVRYVMRCSCFGSDSPPLGNHRHF